MLHAFRMAPCWLINASYAKEIITASSHSQNESAAFPTDWRNELLTLIKAHSTCLILSTCGFGSAKRDDLADCKEEVRWTHSNCREKFTCPYSVCVSSVIWWASRYTDLHRKWQIRAEKQILHVLCVIVGSVFMWLHLSSIISWVKIQYLPSLRIYGMDWFSHLPQVMELVSRGGLANIQIVWFGDNLWSCNC